jgi:hypothetical protein
MPPVCTRRIPAEPLDEGLRRAGARRSIEEEAYFVERDARGLKWLDQGRMLFIFIRLPVAVLGVREL